MYQVLYFLLYVGFDDVFGKFDVGCQEVFVWFLDFDCVGIMYYCFDIFVEVQDQCWVGEVVGNEFGVLCYQMFYCVCMMIVDLY